MPRTSVIFSTVTVGLFLAASASAQMPPPTEPAVAPAQPAPAVPPPSGVQPAPAQPVAPPPPAAAYPQQPPPAGYPQQPPPAGYPQQPPPAGYPQQPPPAGYPQQPPPAGYPQQPGYQQPYAQPGYAQPAYPPPPPREDQAATVRNHDGLYLRLGIGVGYATGGHEEEGVDVNYSGMGVLTEFSLGGTPAPGLVIGGTILEGYVPDMKVEIEYDGQTEEVDADVSGTIGLVGPFVQYYPNPKSGFHFQGAVGYAMAKRTVEDNEDMDGDSDGFGASAGIGFDGWIGEQWSMGGGLRLMYASVSDDGADGTFFVPAATLNFTCH